MLPLKFQFLNVKSSCWTSPTESFFRALPIKVLDQNIDTGNATCRLLFNMLGAIAQFETEIRAERQMEATTKPSNEALRLAKTKSLMMNKSWS